MPILYYNRICEHMLTVKLLHSFISVLVYVVFPIHVRGLCGKGFPPTHYLGSDALVLNLSEVVSTIYAHLRGLCGR